MKGEIIDILLNETLNGKIKWDATSNPFEFYVYYDNVRYSIEQINPTTNYIFRLNKWNENNDPEPIDKYDTVDYQFLLKSLYDIILKTDNELYVRYNTFKKKMSIEENSKDQSCSVSLHKVMKRLGYETDTERPQIHIIETNEFYYKKSDEDGIVSKYVQPPLSQIPTVQGITSLDEAQVVLISAPGATGKTAMSHYISHKLEIPILDLGNYDAVGANTIGGLIMKNIDKDDIFIFHNGLKTGKCSLIIDALDEASIKVTQDGFEAFLKDVGFFAEGAKGLPFVILGRPGVMEDASMILEDRGIKTALLEIEPFTIDKAVEFIDNQLNPDYVQRFDQNYKEVRDYIIQQIGGFFQNESDMNKKLFERFIGYAPVLQSISSLLNERQDFHSLYDELQQSRKQKIELLIDIVKRILKRERDKIFVEVLPQLENNRSEQFKEEIRKYAGEEEEQCRRILGRILNKEVICNFANDLYFNKKYNEKMTEWIRSHPFFKGNEKKIQNIVFESYLIALLIDKKECKEDVLSYLKKSGSCSYLLLDIYAVLNSNSRSKIDFNFFPFLYSSFKSLDHPLDVGTTEIVADDTDDTLINCYLSFRRSEAESQYDFSFTMSNKDFLAIPSIISSLTVDAPINLVFKDKKTEIQAPVFIHCKALSIESRDILLSTPNPDLGSIYFECDEFRALCQDESFPNLVLRTPRENNKFQLTTDYQVFYPFIDYRKKCPVYSLPDKKIYYAFNKLRRLILLCGSIRGKRVLKYKTHKKIDSLVGNTVVGKAIIKKLKNEGVLVNDYNKYYIDGNKLKEVLEIDFYDLRTCVLNVKIIQFLKSVI